MGNVTGCRRRRGGERTIRRDPEAEAILIKKIMGFNWNQGLPKGKINPLFI